ncbi:MAG: hypothetical protein ACREA9_24550 [Pyrinomonadaceae bacterium]
MVDRYPTAASKRCLDPWPLKQACDKHGLPDGFWGLASSIHCPVGMEPGSAWFIVSRVDGNAIDGNALQSLTWTDGTTTTTFQNYVLHRATLVGLDGDGNAPYLLEFRDKRQILKMATVDKEYNVRRTTRIYDTATTDLYYTDSRNAGSDWTWQTMFADLWELLPSAIRGTTPTLATSGYVPTNEPENFRFHGSAWEAISEVLAATHNVLCLNPIADTFTVQRIGSTQSGLTAAQLVLSSAGRLLMDDTPLADLNLSVSPATVRFFFLKRMETEQDLFESEAGGVLVDPYHTIDKTTSITGAQAGTVLPVRTRYVAEVDADGSTINNSATLDTLAGELRDKIVDSLNKGTESGSFTYGGIATTVLPGSEIHDVIWRDYGDDAGCVTVVAKNPRIGMVGSDVPQQRAERIENAIYLGKADGAIANGATTGVVDIYDPTLTTDSGEDITGCYNHTADIADEEAVSVTIVQGIPIVTPLGCP